MTFNLVNAASHRYVVQKSKRSNQGGGKDLVVFCGDQKQILLIAWSQYNWPLKILGWFRYCSVWFVDPTFPESKFKLLKLCMKLLTLD